MDHKDIINKIKPELDKALSFFEKELIKIRTGRASVALVEDVLVDCFGSKLPLKQLAAISCSGPRQLLIQPWDKSYLEPIEKSLSAGAMGALPVVDKDVLRITLPPLTEDFRKMLLRKISEISEETRQTIRRWRDDAWREAQDRARAGEIREDDKFRAKEELQKLVDDYNKKIEAAGERKKKEIES